MDLKDKILREINIPSFYQKFFSDIDTSKNYCNVNCPFHNDDKPSLTIYFDTGAFVCHACDAKGSLFDFYMKKNNVDFKVTLKELANEYNIPLEINRNLNARLPEVEKYHKYLLDNIDESLDYLQKERGLSIDIIKQFKLGYSTRTKRTIFPIFIGNNLVNIRQHSRHKKDRDKGFKVIGFKGFNQVRLYPEIALREKDIFLFAGEMDCLLGHSLGISGSITKTGPENSWNAKFTDLLKGKNVYIVYDNDNAGQQGALKIATALFKVCNEVKVINMPLEGKGEDFTDLIVKYGVDVKDFLMLVEEERIFKITESESTVSDHVHKVTLEDSSLDKYHFKKVEFRAICVGKDLNPYLIPRKIKVSCDMNKNKACAFCKLLENKGEYIIDYGLNDPDILEFVGSSQSQKIGIIKKKISVFNCANFRTEVIEAQNVEEVFLSPDINFRDNEYQDTYRKIYYLGQGLNLNDTYKYNGITVPDPRDQHAIIMVNQALNSETDIDSFKIDDRLKEKLKIFQPEEKDKESIRLKFEEKYKDLSTNIIQIYNRLDLFIAIDLVYHSALKFKFINTDIEKSHLEILVIGDTRTGKSVTAKRMLNHYRAGEIINCEKATIPGLIGGAHDIGSRKILTWGTIPRNDRRLVFLDEADGLDTDTISNLSGIRSSCIAERTIAGGNRRVPARTRLVWIANPRGFKSITEYNTGISAVKVLIGKPEDIARFDLCLAISQRDVPVEIINQMPEEVEHKFTSDLCNKMILWAWSRKEKHIKFTEKAEKSILEYSMVLGNMFSSDIPIVHPNEQRIKLARLASACAIATFSTENGEEVIVDKHHIDFVIDYLLEIFSSPTLSYLSYSKSKIMASTLKNEKAVVDELKRGFTHRIDINYDIAYFVDKLLDSYKLKFDDLMDALQAADREHVRECRQFLLKHRCIKKEHSYWLVTEPFRNLLRELQSELSKSDVEDF